ncbi:MAG TPA: hypothetical protein ENK49_02910 [Gammaproteobacteria bacterium]|nr:hypothetical protein [Gammaproteobacteria bacterium]
MRRLSVFLLLGIAAANLYALTLKEKEGQKTPDRGTAQVEQDEQKKGTPRRSPAPVKNYTPSEKIKADSAVSFPVDI